MSIVQVTKNKHKWITYCEKKTPEKYTKLFLVKERKIYINTSEAKEKKVSSKEKRNSLPDGKTNPGAKSYDM